MISCALLITSGHNKRSIGGRYNYGLQLERKRKYAATLQTHLFKSVVSGEKRQKNLEFPSLDMAICC